MRNVVIVIVSLLLGIAAAIDVPADASVVITSEDGLVVGVGSLARGERLTLDLLEGFRGRARLLLVAPGGAVTLLDVDIVDDILMVDGTNWLERLADVGFQELEITGDAPIAARAAQLREALLPAREEPGTEPATSVPPVDAPVDAPPSAAPPAAPPPAARPPTAAPPAAGPPAPRPPAARPPAPRPPAAGPPAQRPPAAGPPAGVPAVGGPPAGSQTLERVPVEPPAVDAPDDE
jgi:hypothetical protein